MAKSVEWHGNQDESQALVAAVGANCECSFGVMGVRISTCPPHKAMVEDQRFLDGLLFMRRQAAKLLEEESCENSPSG